LPGRGLHHITAISADITRSLDFYTRVLGLRLAKRTVSYEDPGAYHLYYGDASGRPGTLFSFFSWRGVAAGTPGTGEAERVEFAVPHASIGWWSDRLDIEGCRHQRTRTAFGEDALWLQDPDGTPLALVASQEGGDEPAWTSPDIPPRHALVGPRGVTLCVRDAQAMAAILTGVLGFTQTAKEGGWMRLAAHSGAGGTLALHEVGPVSRGRLGAGTIHHVAFRARDAADQAAMADRLQRDFGIAVGQRKDRTYFSSIYFRGPAGIFIEIATDGPGFLVDEPLDRLGAALMLPPFLEPRRAELEILLPPLDQRPTPRRRNETKLPDEAG
jgi:glyoxalase family protein